MKIESFEDLIAWQEARRLTKLIYQLTSNGRMNADKDLIRQMRRASVSVMANIAEGFARYSLRDSKQFFVMSRSSLAELLSHAYVMIDQEYLLQEDVRVLQQQIEVVGKLINGLIRNTRKQLAVSVAEDN